MSSHPARSCLFVYGTLRPGWENPHAKLLGQSAEHLGPARVQGRIFRVNWYPGAVLGGSDWILGNLFGGVTEETLAELDEYEGPHEFRRVETEAWLADGERVRCWIYEYAGPVNEARRIDSGEFTG